MTFANRLIRYGVGSDLADRAQVAGLTVSKLRALAKRDLVGKYRLSVEEVDELKRCIERQPIDHQIADTLLSRSNHTCCVCKGAKGAGVILHHIEEYEISQDNSYGNLAVLCPNDHDRAHRAGLSLGLTERQIRAAKQSWEQQVEVANEQGAARTITVQDDAIDYVNIARIEQMCVHRFGKVPRTTISRGLVGQGILRDDLRFDESFVSKNLSGGSYLFDYINSSESEHYRQLLVELAKVTPFHDLSEGVLRGSLRKLQALEGQYGFFVGGVTSNQPKMPISATAQSIQWKYSTRKLEITWAGDPKYLMSNSSIMRQGRKNRYILYSLVRTVDRPIAGGPIAITCSPLMIAQPSVWVDRTPKIAYRRLAAEEAADEDLYGD